MRRNLTETTLALMCYLLLSLFSPCSAGEWSGSFDRWRSIGGFFPNGAPVTAVARNPNQLDLFIVGNDGHVYTSWWTAGSDWSGLNNTWRDIGGVFPPGARIAAVARNPNQLDLFVTGKNGHVYTSWWTAGSDWSGLKNRWRDIGGTFPVGAPLAAVSRNPNQLDLFVTGKDGNVYTSWWTAGSDWSSLNSRWRDVGGAFPPGAQIGATNHWRNIGGVFPPGAQIAAVARNPNQLDLFITGNNGHVYTSWWTAGSDWTGLNNKWRDIGGVFPVGAPLAVVSRNPNQLDLFVTGNQGDVYTSWWTAGSDWSGLNNKWRDIGGVFPPGAQIAAVSRKAKQLDLFVTGHDGKVYTSWWTAGSDWSGLNNSWKNIGGIFPRDARVAAVARNRDQVDVFITGNDGHVYTSWDRNVDQSESPGSTVLLLSTTGSPDKRLNIVFVPDSTYGNMSVAANRKAFRDAVENVIDSSYRENLAYNSNLSAFNFYYMTVSGTAAAPMSGSICPAVTWPAQVDTDAAFADAVVLLHTNELRDCRTGNRATSEPTSSRTVVHETSHALFNLPDEYCCDGGYWVLKPVLYDSNASCMSDPANAAWRNCRYFTSTSKVTWWRSEGNTIDIMIGGDATVYEMGQGDWVVMRDVLDDFVTPVTPTVFAPFPWGR